MIPKFKTKLKLKNRKKSEATAQFRHEVGLEEEDEEDEEDIGGAGSGGGLIEDNHLCSQIASNLTELISTQLIRLDLIDHLYKERYQATAQHIDTTKQMSTSDNMSQVDSKVWSLPLVNVQSTRILFLNILPTLDLLGFALFM